jgi:hypothetical protein
VLPEAWQLPLIPLTDRSCRRRGRRRGVAEGRVGRRAVLDAGYEQHVLVEELTDRERSILRALPGTAHPCARSAASCSCR